jgi:hypothetical protein
MRALTPEILKTSFVSCKPTLPPFAFRELGNHIGDLCSSWRPSFTYPENIRFQEMQTENEQNKIVLVTGRQRVLRKHRKKRSYGDTDKPRAPCRQKGHPYILEEAMANKSNLNGWRYGRRKITGEEHATRS